MSELSSFEMSNFLVQELVPPLMYKRFGDAAIRYIDPRLIANLNSVRAWVAGPMTINNWHRGGPRVASGIRYPGSPSHSNFSAHSFGMAFDAVGFDVARVRKAIISSELVLPYPCRVELKVGWLHLDVMNYRHEHVETFNG